MAYRQGDSQPGSGPETLRPLVPSGARTSTDVTPERHPSVAALRSQFPEAVLHHEVSAGDQHVVHIPPERNLQILGWLKNADEHRYDFLADLTAVDYGGGRPLQVVYQLWSIWHRRALRVKCALPLTALAIDSVSGLWQAADWLEREVYDMFGIEFRGHPDLRRILMPENYAEGHPLRKDFPLRGRFSRAEQTRRALSQDPRDYYIPEELAIADEPQVFGGEGYSSAAKGSGNEQGGSNPQR